MSLPADIEITVFDAARQIEDPVLRRAFLDWTFRDSPDEGARMKDLLAAESEACSFFNEAAATRTSLAGEILELGRVTLTPDDSAMPGTLEFPELIAGRFRILGRLGEGGGGLVLRAEQTEPVRRKVAIKLLRADMDTGAFVAAFQRERQALAMMNHPNIAGIIDAGSTDSGTPYLVMELVEGQRITRFCDERRASLRERIGLFQQVCSAIQHAHQKGLIHRDIKPSNILVSTADSPPRPQVIDFGIAAAIAEGNATSPLPAGTPPYMSPEQRNSSETDVDTRADIFSLGVLLYELLVGELPWSPGSMPAAIRPPSEHLATLDPARLAELARCRQISAASLVAALRGDLDAIIRKATAADRQHRYDSVAGLAMDLQRHLDIQPVLAHPPGKSYFLRKFARRNRLACLSGAAVLTAIVVGAVLVISSLIRERKALRVAETARAAAARMLVQSAAREVVAQVAILLSQNRIEDADALLLRNPLAGVEPSLEATHVFRFLGERNALLGRWPQAAECFVRLMQANRLVPAQEVAEGMDLLFAAPATLEAGDAAAYDALRQEMLARLPATDHLPSAEHLVKMSLLTPASPATFSSLRPLARLLRENIDSEAKVVAGFRPWIALALALFDYRDRNYDGALEWCRKAEAMPVKLDSRNASLKLIAAMAHHRLGRVNEARREFGDASRMIQNVSSRVIVLTVEDYNSTQGSWYAWSVARILEREARSLLVKP
ncbi:MAG: serine/threonine-protein kinase [Verrucomicrobiota bacterium]